MGESYRGLTIRIGADTERLSKALKSIDNAASQTEAELKKIGKALKVDPSDTQAITTNVRALGDRAEDVAARLNNLRRAEEQASSVAKALAGSTENVALTYNRLIEAYNDADKNLERLNRSNDRIAEKYGITADTARELAEALHEEGLIADEAYEKYMRLAKAHDRIQAEMHDYKQAVQLRDLRAELTASTAAYGALIAKQTAFESDTGRIGRATAEIKSMRDQLEGTRGVADALASELSRVDDSIRLSGGGGTWAVAERMRALREQTELTEQRLSTLRATMWSLDESGVSDAGRTMAELKSRTEAASEAYDSLKRSIAETGARLDELKSLRAAEGRNNGEDTDEYARYERAVRRAEEALADLRRQAAGAAEELDTAKACEGMREMKVEATHLTAELENLKGQTEAVARAEERYIEAQREAALAAGEMGEAGAAVKGLRDDLKATDKVAEALSDELSRLDESLRLSGDREIGAAADRMRTLQEQADLAAGKAERLRKAIAQLNASGADDAGRSMAELKARTEAATKAYDGLQKAVNAAALKVESLEGAARAAAGSNGLSKGYSDLELELGAARQELERLIALEKTAGKALDTAKACEEVRDLRTELTRTESQIKATEAELKSFSLADVAHSLRTAGYALMGTVTPAVSRFASAMLDSAVDIDSAYRDMRKTVEGTEEEFEALRQAALEYSTTHVTSAEEMLSIEAMGGQLGIATSQLEDFALVASNLSIATDLTTDEVAEQLGQLSNILKWGEGDMERYANALVRLGNNMPATESKISDIATRIGASATMVGMSTDEILAWSTAIASTGQQAESAGTAISNTISDIETAVAKGGDKLQGFADVANMTAQEFRAMWAADPSTALKEFVNGLAQIESSGGSADATLIGLSITADRQKTALKGLAQTVGTLDDALSMSSNAWSGISDQWGSAGDAAREAEAKSEGLSGTMSKLSNVAAYLGSTLGESVAPALSEIAGVAAGAVEAFDAMPEPVKAVVVGLIGVAGSAGTVAIAIGAGSYVFDKFSKSVDVATLKTKAFGYALKALKGIGIAGALSILYDLLKWGEERYGEYVEYQEDAAVLSAGVSGAYDKLNSKIEETGDTALSSGQKAQRFAVSMAEGAQAAREAFGGAAEKVEGYASALDSVDGEIESLRNAVGVIQELGGKDNLTTDERNRLNDAVKEYNRLTGDSVRVTDGSTGAISKETDAIEANADAVERKLKVSGNADVIASLKNDLVDAEAALEQARLNVVEAQKALDEARASATSPDFAFGSAPYNPAVLFNLENALSAAVQAEADYQAIYDSTKADLEEYTGQQEALIGSTDGAAASAEAATVSVDELVGRYRALKDGADDAGYSVDEAGGVIDNAMQEYLLNGADLATTTEAINSALSSAGDEQASFTSEMVAAAAAEGLTGEQIVELSGRIYQLEEAEKAAEEAAKKAREELEALVDSVGGMVGSDSGVARWLEMTGQSVEGFAAALQSSGIDASSFEADFAGFAETLRDGSTLIRDSWDEVVSAQEYAENMRQNNIDFDNWQTSLGQLKEVAGATGGDAANEMCTEFAEYLGELGPEYAPLIQEFLADPELFNQAAYEYSQGGLAVAKSFSEGVTEGSGGISETVEQTAEATAEAMTEGVQAGVAESGGAIVDAVVDPLMELPAELEARGNAAGGHYGMGIGSEEALSYVKAGCEALVAQVGESLGGAADVARAAGEDAVAAFAEGVDGAVGVAELSAGSASNAAAEALRAGTAFARQSGLELMLNFNQGMLEGMPYAIATADQLAGAISARMHFSEPTKGALVGINDSGGEMVANYARSMLSKMPALARASDLAARAASFAGAATSATRRYERAAARASGITRSEVYEAVSAAIRANPSGSPAVYVDGKRLAQSISGHMDAELGAVGVRRGR